MTLVEADRPGGDCTFWGCVPSKTLLAAASAGQDLATAAQRLHATVEGIAAEEDAAALGAHGIDVVKGRARLVAPDLIEIDGRSTPVRRLVIAAGGGATLPPIPGLGEGGPLTNETLFGRVEELRRLAVLGGGPIGVEMSQALARLGAEVVLLEREDRVLPAAEPAASAVVDAALRDAGVEVRVGADVTAARRSRAGWRIELGAGGGEGEVISADDVLVAAGRRPRLDGLGLSAAGVEENRRGGIRVNRYLRTTATGVYAAGDALGGPAFTHVAATQGWFAAANALRRGPTRAFPLGYDGRDVPSVVFTDPEVATVGRTASEAATRWRDARVLHLPLTDSDRARVEGRTEGFIRLVAVPRPVSRTFGGGRLVGATIVAPRAGEMLQELVTLVRTRGLPARAASRFHPYPTWSFDVQRALSALVDGLPGAGTTSAAASE